MNALIDDIIRAVFNSWLQALALVALAFVLAGLAERRKR